MKISGFFSLFRKSANTPSFNLTKVASSAEQLRACLKSVANTARDKGFKVEERYDKSMRDNKKLTKSAELNDLKSCLKYAGSQEKHASALFCSTSNPFNREIIQEARSHLHTIEVLCKSARLVEIYGIDPRNNPSQGY